MHTKELIEQLQTIASSQPGRDLKVVIARHSPGSLGASPSTDIVGVHAGIDWNANSVWLTPSKALTQLEPEQVAAIEKSVRGGQSWHAFEAYKKHQVEVDLLKAEIVQLKQQLGVASVAASGS